MEDYVKGSLSNDARYLYEICLAITKGMCNTNLRIKFNDILIINIGQMLWNEFRCFISKVSNAIIENFKQPIFSQIIVYVLPTVATIIFRS